MLLQTEVAKNGEEEKLKETLAQVKLKTKTLAVMSKEENIEKLQTLIKNSNDRFVELTRQWENVKNPLIEEIKLLQDNVSNKETKYQEEQNRLIILKDTYNKLCKDLKDKTGLEQALSERCKDIPRGDNR